MKKLYFYSYNLCNQSPNNSLYKLGIAEENESICNVFFAEEGETPAVISRNFKICDYEIQETPCIKKTHQQFCEYFNKKRKTFDIPITLRGSAFHTSVWKALLAIPYGETRSYSELASTVKNPKACRAVGLANNRNPIPIIVPCHRVIGSNGSLTGYAGGLELKQKLLDIERA